MGMCLGIMLIIMYIFDTLALFT